MNFLIDDWAHPRKEQAPYSAAQRKRLNVLTTLPILEDHPQMKYYSTHDAAKKLGIPNSTLANYVAVGKIPAPPMVNTGKTTTHIWTDEEIERVRKLLPKIANGRKTRYQKLREKQKAQASKPAPRKPKKKKAQ